MAVLQTVEDVISSFLAPEARPCQLDCVDPPLPVATMGMTPTALLTALRTPGNALAPYLYSLANYALSGNPAEGGVPAIPGAPSDAIGAIYLPAGPAYTVNVTTDTPAWWVRVL